MVMIKCVNCKGVDCANCGGSGFTKECKSNDCSENGCNGRGGCYVASNSTAIKGHKLEVEIISKIKSGQVIFS